MSESATGPAIGHLLGPPKPIGSDGSTIPLVQELSHLYFDLILRRAHRSQSLLAEFGLAASQLRALILMNPQSPMKMSEIAQIALLEPSNLTGIVDKLEARGLVKRSLDRADRRVKIVSLTRTGVTLRAQIFDRIREPAPWMLALSERDQRQLLAILRKGLAFEQAAANPPKA